MTSNSKPIIRELAAEEAHALLARNCVGRVAYSWHDRVDIEPIHYVYEAPWIFGRTTAGAKLLALAHNRWCAVEVDEVRSLFDWQSVVVKGPFVSIDPAVDREIYDRAVTALRRLLPSTLTDDDPSPHRDVVFSIHASEITGRSSIANGARRQAVYV